MTDAFIETPAEPSSSRSQTIAAVILGVAATLTALSAYQAALKDGEALQGYTSSTRTLSDANGFYAEASQTFALDQQLFVQYASAAQEGNPDLADYLVELMRPELVSALEWWQATDDAITPFDDADDNPYDLAAQTEAEALEEQAADEFQVATDLDNQGDKFELAAVMLALALFFGGIATLLRRPAVTAALLSLAALMVGLGGFALVTAM